LWNDLPQNSYASKELENIFGKKNIFDNPKPTELIKRCIEISPKGSIVLDFFAGSGTTGQAVLELNNRGETISESELKYISSRQLNIYDCCRSYPSIAEASQRSLKMFNLGGAIERSTRAMYEKRIQNSIQQQICLYACSIGETAEDTSKGGVYSSNLLEVAISIKGTTESYYLVGQTHIAAKSIVKSRGYRQNPDATLPRCISTQQLIFSINPHIYIY
jgi:hypothetical protein